VIAREGAPALAGAVRDAMASLTLRWGHVDGDLLREEGATITLSGRLRDAAVAGIREAAAGEGRVARAAQFVLEVARLLAPAVRLRAQMRLEEASPEEQRRALLAGEPSPPLSESVGRLIALIAAGTA
jgi:hypothetical protein